MIDIVRVQGLNPRPPGGRLRSYLICVTLSQTEVPTDAIEEVEGQVVAAVMCDTNSQTGR